VPAADLEWAKRVVAAEEEHDMSEHKPSEPTPSDFGNVADKSEQAGIADEGAAYTKAIDKEEGTASETEAHPS
jgi:hypothetical protein